MHLWIVRHAIAADRAPDSDADFDRPLTPKGKKLFKAFVEWLAEQGQLPQRILSSPLVRAVETAEILARAAGFKRKDVVIEDVLRPGIDHARFLSVIAGESADSLAVVGHEPDMSALAAALTGARVIFDKGHIACVLFQGTPAIGAGRLEWFMGPSALETD